MGNFFTNVQGRPDDIGNRILRRRIPYNTPGFATGTGIPIGAIERGGIPLRAYALKNTAFSAGATLTLGNVATSTPPPAPPAAQTAGTLSANTASFMATGDTTATTAGEASVGNNTNPGGPLMGTEMPADVIVYAYLAGTAATAGDVTFIVEYAPAYPWSDLYGGQLS